VHLQRRRVDEEARADELLMLVVVAEDVADVLAQEALDALGNSCTRSTSSWYIRQVPSGASGGRGWNGRIRFLTR